MKDCSVFSVIPLTDCKYTVVVKIYISYKYKYYTYRLSSYTLLPITFDLYCIYANVLFSSDGALSGKDIVCVLY